MRDELLDEARARVDMLGEEEVANESLGQVLHLAASQRLSADRLASCPDANLIDDANEDRFTVIPEAFAPQLPYLTMRKSNQAGQYAGGSKNENPELALGESRVWLFSTIGQGLAGTLEPGRGIWRIWRFALYGKGRFFTDHRWPRF